jgi:hypothetical protein
MGQLLVLGLLRSQHDTMMATAYITCASWPVRRFFCSIVNPSLGTGFLLWMELIANRNPVVAFQVRALVRV